MTCKWSREADKEEEKLKKKKRAHSQCTEGWRKRGI